MENSNSLLSDQHWRLNHLYTIVNEQGHEGVFRMNQVQEALYWEMWYWNLILKSRQHGITTFICMLMLDTALFNSNQSCGIIAHRLEDAKKIFKTKILHPYSKLPAELKNAVFKETENTLEIWFSNGSSIVVGVSMRSGTCQILHISEFGKICAKFPDKAKEVVTGGLNTLHSGSMLFIESTAEGRQGYFYDYTREAQANMAREVLSKKDMKFFFFPWFKDKRNRLESDTVLITKDLDKYFARLKQEQNIVLDPDQKAWYAATQKTQKDDMKREHPSTPDEAFEAAVEGNYYGKAIARARYEKRIRPHIPLLIDEPIFTFWDLGMDDFTAIWFMQYITGEYRFIDYYENHGYDLAHYAKVLLREKSYIYKDHYLPHDVEVESLSTGKTRKQTLEALQIKPVVVVDRIDNINDGIAMVRNVLPQCYFDESKCAIGIQRLENYRQAYDDKLGTYKDKPLHDDNEHGASAFRMFAQGFRRPQNSQMRRNKKRHRNWRHV